VPAVFPKKKMTIVPKIPLEPEPESCLIAVGKRG